MKVISSRTSLHGANRSTEPKTLAQIEDMDSDKTKVAFKIARL